MGMWGRRGWTWGACGCVLFWFVWFRREPFTRAGAPASITPKALLEDRPCAARSRSKPIGESQLDKVGNPVGIKSPIADFVLSVLLPGILAPARPTRMPRQNHTPSKKVL